EDLEEVSGRLENAFKVIEADRGKVEMQLREIASLQADVQALREVRAKLEGQVAALSTQVTETAEARDAAAAERDRLTEELRLTTEQREALLAELGTLRDRS